MKVIKVLGAIVSVVAVSVGSIGLGAGEVKAQTMTQNYFQAVSAGLNRLGIYDRASMALYDNDEQSHLLAQGVRACSSFEQGYTPRSLFTETIEDGYGIDVASNVLVQAAAAALTLCPQYSYLVDSASEQSSNYYSSSQSNNAPGWMYLTASDSTSRINLRESPSTSAVSHHYGLVGDRVWASQTTVAEGYTWYFVGFPESGATGWIRGDLITQ